MNHLFVDIVSDRAGLDAWLAVPSRVFAGDPHYVPPLRMLERRRMARSKNPFFRFADVEMFVAFNSDGNPVGRISAQINRRYQECQGGATGHFGFFDTIDNQAVAAILINTASRWLAARGMRRMEGPFNFSINEECGMLVAGFDTSPAVMMPHARRWQSGYLEAAGLTSVMDLYAFRLPSFELPERITWLAEGALSDRRISVRSFDRRALGADIALMVDIFNDAWQNNWGFVPLTAAEIEFMIGDLRPFIRGHYGKFVCLDGEPVGFYFVCPNINEAIAGFGGRLLPFNWFRLGLTLLRERVNTGRMALLGLRRAYHGSLRGTQLFAAMMREHARDFERYRVAYAARTDRREGSWIELSWVLASNRPLITFLRSLLGEPVKTYRIYGKDIES